MAKSNTLKIGIDILKAANGKMTQSQFLEEALKQGLERNKANGSIGALVTQKLADNSDVEVVDGKEQVVLVLTEAGKAWEAPVAKPAPVPMSLKEKREHRKEQRRVANAKRKAEKAGSADLAGF